MSAMADVMRLTSRFIATKEPADALALGIAYEAMTQEEEEQVSGGCPDIVGAY